MKLITLQDENELSIFAANLVIDRLNQNPQAVLVFPTGNTPLGMFEQLVQNYQKGKVSFRVACLIELDEYFGISLDDPCNLFNWLDRTLLQKVDFMPENIYRFNSAAPDAEAETRRIEKIIKDKKGIDLLLLGLGPNGHIGFNEPGSSAFSQTRIVQLSQDSLRSNSRYWGEDKVVPTRGFTLGMSTIMSARDVVLLVQGESKAEILDAAINGPISKKVPASFLRQLEKFTILADKEAACQVGHSFDSIT
jgi:glucosamine-6-phosphate deaminase